ncbi:MAG: TonB-dependent receptor [Pseudomonadota bacterium]
MNKRKFFQHLISQTAAIAIAAATSAGPAAAQLDEIVVTAQKKEESLQDAPLSVAAYTEDTLEAQGVRSLTDLSIQAPSLQAYDFPTSTSNISLFLRGFGNTDSQTLTIDNPIGVYIDGVYIARTSGATLNVLDLERVEILRGPQGTLFGRNSSAGAINLITKEPDDEFGVRLKFGGGNFGRWNGGFTADVPVTDRFAVKASYDISQFNGWVENDGPNPIIGQQAEDFYSNDQQGFRLAAKFDATEALDATYSFDWSDVDSGPPYYQQDPTSRQESTSHLFLGGAPFQYVLPTSETRQSGHNLTVEWALSEAINIKSITGYRKMRERAAQNWSDTLFFATDLTWETETFTQELQILGDAFEEQFDYIVGFYYFDEDGEKSEEQFTNAPSMSFDALADPLASTSVLLGGSNLGIHTIDTESKSTAVFAQGTFTPAVLGSKLSLTAGVRYTDDSRDAVRGVDPVNPSIQFFPGQNSLDYDRVDYTAVLNYAVTDTINAYFRTATGYRAGGSGERTLDFGLTFDEEDSTSYEIGLKAELFDRRLRINAAGFMTDYENLILTISGQPPDFASFVENVNAGEASVDGVELDVIAALGERATVTVNYAHLDTDLEGVIVPLDSFLLGGPPASVTDLRGVDISTSTFIAFAPNNAVSAAFDYSLPLKRDASLDFHINYTWRVEVFSQPGLGLPVDPIGLLGARLSWTGIEVGGAEATLSAWVRNLTDREEIVYNLSGLGFQYNAPRLWGLDLSLEF